MLDGLKMIVTMACIGGIEKEDAKKFKPHVRAGFKIEEELNMTKEECQFGKGMMDGYSGIWITDG